MIALRAGKMRLVLDDATGGAIASLEHDGTPLLRPVADPRLHAQQGRAVAAYPLLPFANRVAFGRFSLAGKRYQLAPNFGDEPHAIHGNGWMHPWAVETSAGTAAALRLDYTPRPGEWPFAYRAEQVFTLEPHALRLDIRLTNTDAAAWPAGIGLHPYVARTASATIAFKARTVWTNGADGLPEQEILVPPSLDFSRARTVGAEAVDRCFAGWQGQAAIGWPEHGLELRIEAAPPLGHLQVYTPAGRDFMGIEPVSNMPDAINRMANLGFAGGADQGLVMLKPGETLQARIILAVEASHHV